MVRLVRSRAVVRRRPTRKVGGRTRVHGSRKGQQRRDNIAELGEDGRAADGIIGAAAI